MKTNVSNLIDKFCITSNFHYMIADEICNNINII